MFLRKKKKVIAESTRKIYASKIRSRNGTDSERGVDVLEYLEAYITRRVTLEF